MKRHRFGSARGSGIVVFVMAALTALGGGCGGDSNSGTPPPAEAGAADVKPGDVGTANDTASPTDTTPPPVDTLADRPPGDAGSDIRPDTSDTRGPDASAPDGGSDVRPDAGGDVMADTSGPTAGVRAGCLIPPGTGICHDYALDYTDANVRNHCEPNMGMILVACPLEIDGPRIGSCVRQTQFGTLTTHYYKRTDPTSAMQACSSAGGTWK